MVCVNILFVLYKFLTYGQGEAVVKSVNLEKEKNNKKRKKRKKKVKDNNSQKLTFSYIKSQNNKFMALANNRLSVVSSFIKDCSEIIFKKKKESVVSGFVIFFAFCIAMNILMWLICLIISKPIPVKLPAFIMFLCMVIPFVMWVWSTSIDFWCFHNRKKGFFYLCYANIYLLLMVYIYNTVYKIVISRVENIPVTAFLDEVGHKHLTQIALIYASLGYGLLLGYAFFNPKFLIGQLDEPITYFKITHHLDTRKNKEQLYDFSIVHKLKNGKPIVVMENDRFTGTLVDGASGTGKTSTIFTTSIGEDFKKKFQNLEALKLEFYKLFCDGKIRLKPGYEKPVYECGEFNARAFEPNTKNSKKYKEIEKTMEELIEKYPNCGVTAIAPNAGLPGDVIKLCKKLGFSVSVIDPMPDEETGEYKENYTGINPFWINPQLKERDKLIDIADKSAMFADIMSALNDESGSMDPYFAGINKSVTVNVAIVCMAAASLTGQQTDIFEIQQCINNFSNLKSKIQVLEKKYGAVHVEETESAMSRKRNKKCNEQQNLGDNASTTGSAFNVDDEVLDAESETIGDEPVKPEQRKTVETILHDASDGNPYHTVIYTIKTELLGEGSEKMFDQARGLRNQINNFLLHPHIKRVFMYKEKILDFDRAFRDGEITVVNTALELGDSQSKAFGLYIILLFRQAMFRRPMKTRTCRHWCYIDELPVYLNPSFEALYSLARQYRVGFYSAIQTLAQMKKNSTTEYLKGVLQGAGTHIIFGRVNEEEIASYEALGAKKLVEKMKVHQSTSSLLSADGSYSQSVSYDSQEQNILSGFDLRNRDFIELTIFTSDNGNVRPPEIAKAHFIDMNSFDELKRAEYTWVSAPVKLNKELIHNDEPEEDIAFPDDMLNYEKVYSEDEAVELITPAEIEYDNVIGLGSDIQNVSTSFNSSNGVYPEQPNIATGDYEDNEMPAALYSDSLVNCNHSPLSPDSSKVYENAPDESMPDAELSESDLDDGLEFIDFDEDEFESEALDDKAEEETEDTDTENTDESNLAEENVSSEQELIKQMLERMM